MSFKFASPRSWIHVLVSAIVFVLFWLSIFSPPALPVIPEGDISWSAALIHFAADKLQFGREVIFTYGPLSYLISFIYTGELFSSRIVWEVISKSFFAGVLCVAMFRLPKVWRIPFVLFLLLFVWADGAPDSMYFLVISCLTAFLLRNYSTPLGVVAAVFFAIASLIKFTYMMLGVLAVIAIVASCLVQRRPVRGFGFLIVFVICLFVCWQASGQWLQNFVSYVTTSVDVSSHYKSAMSLPASSDTIIIVGAVAAILGLLQCGALAFSGGRAAVIFALFLAAELILVWNRAMVRADDHVLNFFCLCPLMLLTGLLVLTSASNSRIVASWTNMIVLGLCLWGIALQKPGTVRGWFWEATDRMGFAGYKVLHPQNYAEHLSHALADAKDAHELSGVRKEIGGKTVDVFGFEQGIALLNDLNYQPRPAFQSYSAYSSALIDANMAHYTSLASPNYVLFKYQTIDNRYPSLDDAEVLTQLLLNYKPVLEEKGYLVWKKEDPPSSLEVSNTLKTSLPFDREFTLPSIGWQWLQLEIKPSRLGRLLNFFYKLPQISLRVNDNQGHQADYRLIPDMAAKGFLINPYLKDTRQVLRTATGEGPERVTSFSIHVAGGHNMFFRKRISLQLGTVDEGIAQRTQN
jgi:hypothetical protein